MPLATLRCANESQTLPASILALFYPCTRSLLTPLHYSGACEDLRNSRSLACRRWPRAIPETPRARQTGGELSARLAGHDPAQHTVCHNVCAAYVCRICMPHMCLYVCRYAPHEMKDITQYQAYRTPDIKDIAGHLASLVGQPVHGGGQDAVVLQMAGHLATCSSVPISKRNF